MSGSNRRHAAGSAARNSAAVTAPRGSSVTALRQWATSSPSRSSGAAGETRERLLGPCWTPCPVRRQRSETSPRLPSRSPPPEATHDPAGHRTPQAASAAACKPVHGPAREAERDPTAWVGAGSSQGEDVAGEGGSGAGGVPDGLHARTKRSLFRLKREEFPCSAYRFSAILVFNERFEYCACEHRRDISPQHCAVVSGRF
jgi:hypothetical protein